MLPLAVAVSAGHKRLPSRGRGPIVAGTVTPAIPSAMVKYQSELCAKPSHCEPRRAGGIIGPDTNEITRTPPSHSVCLPPRNG